MAYNVVIRPVIRPRVRRLVALAMSVAMIVGGSAAPAWAGPFPPQMPSADEMARLQKDLSTSLASVRAAQAKLDQAVRAFEAAQNKADELNLALAKTQEAQQVLDGQQRAIQTVINSRAASAYRGGRTELVNVLMESRNFRQFVIALDLLQAVTTTDGAALKALNELKGQAELARARLDAERSEQQRVLAELQNRQRAMQSSMQAVGRKYESIRSEVDKRKSGFAFPVRAPYSYTDSFGAPRMEGTKFFHKHQGTDIFALKGTPIYAVVDGVIERVGTDTLGGTKLWLRSPGDNWSYYYAHLSGYAPGIRDGLRVKKGSTLGYVGNTGNAITTPSHLHFETHVPSGPATNPYPILKRVNPLK
jgi:murein DD-endopeptidase MepM/ murein hydrolase activator NlpD